MTAGEFSDRAIATIDNKRHSSSSKPLHLLVYVTHWAFSPSETAIRLVQHQLRSLQHPLENIFFLKSLDDREATVRVLFPVPDSIFEGIDAEKARENGRYVFGPRDWTLVKEPAKKETKSSMVKDINVSPSDDGSEVTLTIIMEGNDTSSITIPFEHFDWLQSKLLVAASQAFTRQVERGILARVRPENAAMTAEGFRVIEKTSDGVALVQLIARPDSNAPQGLGSFEVNQELASALGKRLSEVADRLAPKELDPG